MKSNYFKDIDKVFEKYSTVLKRNIQNELSWTDNLKNLVDVQPEGTSVIMTMPLYGWVVNTGRRPGAKMPPFGKPSEKNNFYSPLTPWLMKKWGITEKEAWNKSFIVALKIHKVGIKARPWVEKAVVVPQLMEAIANKIVYNMIREIEITENEGKFVKGRVPYNKNSFK